MPEGRLQRTRPTLPEGYQYGDARVLGALLHRRGPGNVMLTGDGLNELIWKCFPSEWRRHTGAYADAIRGINAVNSERADSWRAPHENAAEQLTRRQREGVAAWGDGIDAAILKQAQRTGEDTI